MSFRFTDRDMQLLTAVSRFRFLTSEQLKRIDGGSDRGVRNRLLHLTRAGHLLRVRSSLTASFAYGLGNTGARLLAERGHAVNHRLDWTDKNDRTHFFLEHTIHIANVVMNFERAASGIAELRDHHDAVSGFSTTTFAALPQNTLRVSVSPHERPLVIPIIPDRLLALTYPDTTVHHFALELDRGSMDIWANRLVNKSSFRRKLLAYAAARDQRRFADVWDCKSLRVLTVTTSDKRIEHMLAAQRRAVPQHARRWRALPSTGRWVPHGQRSKTDNSPCATTCQAPSNGRRLKFSKLERPWDVRLRAQGLKPANGMVTVRNAASPFNLF